MLKKRRIRGHLNHITIPLNPNHKHSLRNRTNQRRPPISNSRVRPSTSILANEDPEIPISVIISVEERNKLVRFEVVMDIQPDPSRLRAW